MLLTFSAFAQQGSDTLAACGPKGTQFEMKRDESRHTLVQPDPGKAQVYFVQDIGAVNCLGSCSTRIGVDGEWVGANQHNSYFSLPVEPGDHHVCVNMAPQFSPHSVALAHFTAEAGKVYYFRVRPFWGKDQLLSLDLVDADEGKYLVTYYPLCVSHPKP
jgi:hypothetical protein